MAFEIQVCFSVRGLNVDTVLVLQLGQSPPFCWNQLWLHYLWHQLNQPSERAAVGSTTREYSGVSLGPLATNPFPPSCPHHPFPSIQIVPSATVTKCYVKGLFLVIPHCIRILTTSGKCKCPCTSIQALISP